MKPTSLALALLLAFMLTLFRRRLNRAQLALGALAVGWLSVHGSGLVHLPDLEEPARQIGPTLGGWAYPAIGLMAFLETAFFLGLVAPGEISVILGGFIAGQGEIDVVVLGAIVFACAAAGDTTSYLLGRKLGHGVLLEHGARFGVTEERLARFETFFRAHGAKTILLGRFVGAVRAIAPFAAGASKMSARRFLPIDYASAAVWSLTFVTLGYIFSKSLDTAISIAKQGTLAFGVLLLVVVAVTAGLHWLKQPTNHTRLRHAWQTRSLRPLRAKTEP
jgi:membrane protein DedA with SNARE-associated domain